jgi:hypothetical protein
MPAKERGAAEMGDHRKGQTNLRLSDEARKLLDLVSEMYGISMADVVEIALRKYAQELGLWRPKHQK